MNLKTGPSETQDEIDKSNDLVQVIEGMKIKIMTLEMEVTKLKVISTVGNFNGKILTVTRGPNS